MTPSLCSTVYVTRQFGSSSYGSLAGERCVSAHSCTLGMPIHADSWLTQMQRGINVRNQLHGLNLAFSGCGLTPHAVCVTVSHGKNCSAAELWARGWCCRSRMCFQWWGLAMHVDMLGEILSTLCPRHLMSVRSIESQWPHTHTVYTHCQTKICSLCNFAIFSFLVRS